MAYQLIIEAGVGIAVLVRCFVNKRSMETLIIDRLGNGFSRAPFATVVVIFKDVSQTEANMIFFFLLT